MCSPFCFETEGFRSFGNLMLKRVKSQHERSLGPWITMWRAVACQSQLLFELNLDCVKPMRFGDFMYYNRVILSNISTFIFFQIMNLKNPYKSSEWEHLHYLLAAWPLAHHLNSLSLSFLYKIEIIRSIHFRVLKFQWDHLHRLAQYLVHRKFCNKS